MSNSNSKTGIGTSRGRRAKPAGLTALEHSQSGRLTEVVSEKIICAKSVLQAVMAAADAETLEGENYDIHWPLSVVMRLLEEASSRLDDVEAATSHMVRS